METRDSSSEGESERHAVLEQLRKYGWNSTSFQVLEPGFRYWFERDCCVAYVDTGSAWVAAGAPIAHADSLAECARQFVDAARAAGRRACFFAVERRFVATAELATLLIGEQPVWDLGNRKLTDPKAKSLREQLRRARAKGVTVRRLDPSELVDPSEAPRLAVEALIGRWGKTRQLAPMGFLVAIHPFHFPEERRYFVAERAGNVVAFLAMVPVYSRGGWLLEDFLRDPAAPNGTVELVIDHALRAIADEGARYATLGLAPLSGNVNGWLRAVRDASGPLYDFHGLHAFKKKLRPERWDEVFLAFPEDQNRVLTVLDVLSAFSREGLLRFGIETLLRVPGVVIQCLATLLLPWALFLALLDPDRWFSTRWAQVAWVSFHLGLAVALFRLARSFRPMFALWLAGILALDTLLSVLEVALGPSSRHHLPGSFGAVVAVLVPAMGAALLFRGWWFRRD